MTTRPIILDMTRSVLRRIKGNGPTGLDRVSDAYCAHFARNSHAAFQILGRLYVLDRPRSRRVLEALSAPDTLSRFRMIEQLFRALSGVLTGRTARKRLSGGIYIYSVEKLRLQKG